MDFVFDRTAEGRVLKCLTIVDDATHEAVAVEVERAISGHGVARVMDRLALSRGLPKIIRSDNGKEFCGKAMVQWAYERGVTLRLIEPGKPNQNAYIESFNGRLRHECLNEHWFSNLMQARRDRNRATRIQRRATEEIPWWDDPRGLCEAPCRGSATVRLYSKQPRYLRRGKSGSQR